MPASADTTPGANRAGRAALVGVAIFAFALAGLLIGIAAPGHPYFDEVHYIPAARQLLEAHGIVHAPLTPEHPPLGKELIALGMALWGDNPFGWRFMSAVFGAVALLATYFWSLALFDDHAPARWATMFTALDQFLYVQARLAMLDVFAVASVLCGFAAWTRTWRPGARVRPLMVATGAAFALATACKWVGLFAFAFWVGSVGTVLLLRHWRTRFADPRGGDWFRPDLWAEMGVNDWLLAMLVVPLVVYSATFLPLTGLSLFSLVRAQAEMWRMQSTLVTATHPYASAWDGWPVLARPVWYLFEPSGTEGRFFAVLLLGNPAVMWPGAVALVGCASAFVWSRRADAFLIVGFWASLYLPWAVSPRSPGFLYYYVPAAMAVGPALAFVLWRTALVRVAAARWVLLAVALAGFVTFLPISSTVVPTTLATFNGLMWFSSWR